MASKRWAFFGRVLPERVPLSWPTSLKAVAKSNSVIFEYSVAIHASQVVIDVAITEGDPDLVSLRNLAESCARMITDLIGYQQGSSFDVEIISAIDKTSDNWRIFGIEIPVLAERHKGQPSEISGELLKVVGRSIPAQIALADFREAMRIPVGTSFFCYRAIEAMMQSMRIDEKEKDSDAWERFRKNLQLDRPAIDYIGDRAKFIRHGKPINLTDTERAQIFKIADEVIRRYLEYLSREQRPLSEQEFPILRMP